MFQDAENRFTQLRARSRARGEGGTPLMKFTKWRTAALALLAVALAAGAALSTASASTHARQAITLTIWADASRTPPVTKLANQWAAANGATIKVVNKGTDPGVIRSGLSTVAAADAPDIVV